MSEHNLIETRIQEKYDSLSAQEQKAAQVILENLEDLAVFSSAEIAQMSGVSRPTVSRLYRSLGFESFSQVKEHARSQRSRGVPVPSEKTEYGQRLSAEMELIARTAAVFEKPAYSKLVERASVAEKILVVGFRNSYMLGLHLRNQLIQARSRVVLAPSPGQTLAEELYNLDENDLVILCGVRRRTQNFETVLRACAASPASLALLTDPSGRKYSGRADMSLEIHVETEGAFDSYAGWMSFVSIFADDVLGELGEDGAANVARITGLFDQLGELDF